MLTVLCVSMLLTSCEWLGFYSASPPAYIKQVVAYKEGSNGLMVYMTLADATGQMTTADGMMALGIDNSAGTHILFRKYEVRRRDFVRTRVGLGAFEHVALLFPVGRLPYTEFDVYPRTSDFGKVEIILITQGRVLEGQTSVIF